MKVYAVMVKHTGERWIDTLWALRDGAAGRRDDLDISMKTTGVTATLWIAEMQLEDCEIGSNGKRPVETGRKPEDAISGAAESTLAKSEPA